MDNKSFFDDSSNSIISHEDSYHRPRPLPIHNVYRYEIGEKQANIVLATGYFSVIFAVFVSNVAFGIRDSVDAFSLSLSCVLLIIMSIIGCSVIWMKYRGKIKSVRTLPGLYLTLSLMILVSNINTISYLRGDEPMDVAPPIYVFVGIIITLLPIACEYVYTRTLGSTLLILVFTTIVQFAVSDSVSVGIGVMSLALMTIIQNMFMSMNRSGKIGINKRSYSKVADDVSLSGDENGKGGNQAVEQFEQIVRKTQQAEELLDELIDSDARADKRLHQIAALLEQINEQYAKGSTAFKKFIENYKDLISNQQNKFLATSVLCAPVSHSENAKILVKRGQAVPQDFGTQELAGLLKELGKNWNFDMFFITDLTNSPIVVTGTYMITTYQIPNIDHSKLKRYLTEMERLYKDNAYHNMTHAADVMNSFIYLIESSDLIKHLTNFDMLCWILASIGHDVAHSGLTNRFLINTKHKLALKYNDTSVLESMHCALTFKTLLKPENNIIADLSYEDFWVMRKIMVAMILNTDMAKHFDMVVHFRNTCLSKEHEMSKFDDRLQALIMVMKCSDIGHAAKKTDLHLKWSGKICEEFYRQGDIEREKGLPISIFCDRHNTDLGESQSGFIGNIVLPLFEVTNKYIDSESVRVTCIKQLQANYQYWRMKRHNKSSRSNKTEELPPSSSRDGHNRI